MRSADQAPSPLDKALDPVHYAEAVEARVPAPPGKAFEAALAVTLADMTLSRTLFLLRSLPRIVASRRLPRWRMDRPFLEALVSEPGFLLLVEPADAFAAIGYVGRPWRPTAEPRLVGGPEEFVAFEEPGWAKVVMDLGARPDAGAGAILRTETRIHLTDEHARRAFARYWLLVRLGSAAVRKDWLRAARRRSRS